MFRVIETRAVNAGSIPVVTLVSHWWCWHQKWRLVRLLPYESRAKSHLLHWCGRTPHGNRCRRRKLEWDDEDNKYAEVTDELSKMHSVIMDRIFSLLLLWKCAVLC